jgi:hypothetical protein
MELPFQIDVFSVVTSKKTLQNILLRVGGPVGKQHQAPCRRRYTAITPEFAPFDLICGRRAQFKERLR